MNEMNRFQHSRCSVRSTSKCSSRLPPGSRTSRPDVRASSAPRLQTNTSDAYVTRLGRNSYPSLTRNEEPPFVRCRVPMHLSRVDCDKCSSDSLGGREVGGRVCDFQRSTCVLRSVVLGEVEAVDRVRRASRGRDGRPSLRQRLVVGSAIEDWQRNMSLTSSSCRKNYSSLHRCSLGKLSRSGMSSPKFFATTFSSRLSIRKLKK